MPTYDIIDDETSEHFTIFCKYSELEQHLVDNPTWRKLISAPAIVGDHVVKRMDGGMKEVFSRVAKLTQTVHSQIGLVIIEPHNKRECKR